MYWKKNIYVATPISGDVQWWWVTCVQNPNLLLTIVCYVGSCEWVNEGVSSDTGFDL